MKLKTRIIVGFVAIILLPLLLFSASLYGFSQTQAKHVQESSSQASDSNQMIYDISLAQSSSSQVKLMAKDMILTATIILVFTALSVGLWIYRSIAVPLVKLKKATQNIKEGNLDFVLDTLCAEPIPAAPDMPCVCDVLDGVIVNTKFCLMAQKGTNPAILQKINDALQHIYETNEEYVKNVEDYSYQSAKPMTIEETLAELETQYQTFQGYKQYLG